MFSTTDRFIRVRIAHPEFLLSMGLAAALDQQQDIEVVADDGDARNSTDSRRAHVVITDRAGGVALALRVRELPAGQRATAPKVLVISSSCREHETRTALEAGVQGYLLQDCGTHELINGVRQLHQGARYLGAAVAQEVAASLAREPLTLREQQVLHQLVTGKGNKAIANALGISEGTVKAHVKAILTKLQAATRTEAVGIAVQRGLVPRPRPAGMGSRPSAARHVYARDAFVQ
ncbi:response regulator transcription factor [Variovorax sp. J22P168]|uniref:response regulator transcription factor n=1 Tax=Variovorax jilinensis TaxID=3053513 RepID=UPI002576E2E8|nr:response regulator transcription factor [Variovorax sp. J22P168]MDM0015870.1 response regulator transcription factor [Variovorax sp. J22P168]